MFRFLSCYKHGGISSLSLSVCVSSIAIHFCGFKCTHYVRQSLFCCYYDMERSELKMKKKWTPSFKGIVCVCVRVYSVWTEHIHKTCLSECTDEYVCVCVKAIWEVEFIGLRIHNFGHTHCKSMHHSCY